MHNIQQLEQYRDALVSLSHLHELRKEGHHAETNSGLLADITIFLNDFRTRAGLMVNDSYVVETFTNLSERAKKFVTFMRHTQVH